MSGASSASGVATDVDLGLFLVDLGVFRRLIVERDGLRALALAPYVAMFVVESFAFLRRRRAASGSLGDHEPAINQCRHTLKFLDDDQRGVAGVLALYERMRDASYQSFVGSHVGLLGPLKRWLQPDVSVFVHDGRAFGTSDAVLVQQLAHRDHVPSAPGGAILGPELHDRSVALGEYIGRVATAFNVTADGHDAPALSPSAGVDAKGRAFYGRLLRLEEEGVGVAMMLTSLLGSTNFVLYVLPAMAGRRGALDVMFTLKWRLITLFHVYSSLGLLTAGASKDVLRLDVRDAIIKLRRSSRHVENLKRLRDGLVHYDLAKDVARRRETPEASLQRMLSHARPIEETLASVSATLARFLPTPQRAS